MTKNVKLLLKARNLAFWSGDIQQYRTSRMNLKKGIRDAKVAYKQKIENHFNNSDPRRAWQGIRHITGQNNSSSLTNSSATEAEELNQFISRFEVKRSGTTISQASAANSQTFVIQPAEVTRILCKINTRKAAGPDGIPGRVLRVCAAELGEVFTNIFNLSLLKCTVPTCLKTSIIVPVPKHAASTSPNDYRPIALTSVIMKSMERLVLHRIKADLSPTLDPDQYAYRANRSKDDAISAVLHTVLCHLEHQGSYARLLFLDFSSAFNTVLPNRLFTKMSDLGFQHNICLWIKDFLTEQPQSVRMGSHNSSTLTISTGVPQECVLSPFLYSLYTYDCIPSEEIKRLMVWCTENNLALNIKKTKELIIDFRRNQDVHTPLYINEEMVERVSCFKFLGTYISEDLSWTKNIMALVKKAQKRLYFRLY
ncbi:RNA-directed DNA polymerase from mobile element jockey [Labeo rohita]|uniref:RNA-directed DNA polymerase from mobile element jockey n=1 Tax=Labeo rohita TaxID=84645 RepID=A0ABQ8L629_LABRO|nr:RNA-directed DNA polymerase from mobile element jockey [Labeo rohita]